MAWETLLGMIKEGAEIDAEDRSGVPSSCAVDYTALVEAQGGVLHCPWCGLNWPDDASAWGEFPGSF